uniref:DDB1-and CUL4-associated factor 13-like n=1 Tax=Rhizophora mucronata TaxID=61149 RepID=A0A2P2LPH9_RHIMU
MSQKMRPFNVFLCAQHSMLKSLLNIQNNNHFLERCYRFSMKFVFVGCSVSSSAVMQATLFQAVMTLTLGCGKLKPQNNWEFCFPGNAKGTIIMRLSRIVTSILMRSSGL